MCIATDDRATRRTAEAAVATKLLFFFLLEPVEAENLRRVLEKKSEVIMLPL